MTGPNDNPNGRTGPIKPITPVTSGAPTTDAAEKVRAHLPERGVAAQPGQTGEAATDPSVRAVPAHPPVMIPYELAEMLRRGNLVAIRRRRD